MKPTGHELDLTKHLLRVIEGLPHDLRSLIIRDDSVTFALSYEDYCRGCHMGCVLADVTLTYAELLTRTEPQWEGDPDIEWDQWAVIRLVKTRWDEAIAIKRAAGYRHE